MKQRRFDFNFRPLQIDISFTTVGSIPSRQNYDATTGEYTPDYRMAGMGLTIQPEISVIDRDGVIPTGRINSSLANVRWYEIDNSVRTLITSENTNYTITTAGANAGRIVVKRNATVETALTLEFYAEYADVRTRQLYKIRDTFPIFCDNATAGFPVLTLNAADQTLYNPLASEATQLVKASLTIAGDEISSSNRIFVWEKRRSDNSWSVVGAEEALDYDVTVAANGVSVTVNRSLMGTELYLRCRAKYDALGNPASVTLTDSSPCQEISFIRRIPKYEYDISGVPSNIPDVSTISPIASIWDKDGVISDPERELLPLWYVAPNKSSGTLSYSQIGHGMNPVLPTDAMTFQWGAVYGLDVVDCGATCGWEDSDGGIFVDENGKVILIK